MALKYFTYCTQSDSSSPQAERNASTASGGASTLMISKAGSPDRRSTTKAKVTTMAMVSSARSSRVAR